MNRSGRQEASNSYGCVNRLPKPADAVCPGEDISVPIRQTAYAFETPTSFAPLLQRCLWLITFIEDHRLLDEPMGTAMKVRKTLYKMATSGRNQVATMFWLKTRAGWSEKGKEPEVVEEREKPLRLVVRFVTPNRCKETGELLETDRGR